MKLSFSNLERTYNDRCVLGSFVALIFRDATLEDIDALIVVDNPREIGIWVKLVLPSVGGIYRETLTRGYVRWLARTSSMKLSMG